MTVIRDFLSWIQRILQATGSGIVDRARSEPVGTATLVRLGLYAAAAFGLDWTSEQMVALAAFTEGVTLWYARHEVTPTSAPTLPLGTIVNAKSGEPTGVVVESPDSTGGP